MSVWSAVRGFLTRRVRVVPRPGTAVAARPRGPRFLMPADGRGGRGSGGWWPIIRESFSGAWQQNIELTPDTVLAHAAVYACITLISTDISKLRIMLVEQDADGIWHEVEN